MPPAHDAIVVGGGVAGLAAATALAAAGGRVLVLEARGVLGGRASSFVHRETASTIDTGQHVVLGCYHETFAFLDRVGARHAIALHPRLEVPLVDADGRRTTFRCPDWPAPLNVLGAIAGWGALAWRDRLSVVSLAPALWRAREAVRLEANAVPSSAETNGQGRHESVADWLRRYRQSPRLCELLWEPLALAALNQPIEAASAEAFRSVLGGVLGPGRQDAAIGVPSRPLSDVFGTPARRFLESNGSVVMLHAPARLLIERERVSGVAVRGAPLRAGTVVAAVPWTSWRNLIDQDAAERGGLGRLRREALARRSSPIVTVNLWLDEPVVGGAFVGLPRRTFQWAFEKMNPSAPGGALAHVSLVSSGADDIVRTPDAILVERAWSELRLALPRASRARLCHAAVVRERHATFSLAPGEPDRPCTDTPVSGLWLAGDWTRTGLPATIEGAARSGHAAARAILGARDTPTR
jgi:squalene-associated FAD-dependent desaturase